MTLRTLCTIAVLLFSAPDAAFALTPQEINQAAFDPARPPRDNAIEPFVIKAQILLGRRGISPGVVDGIDGENFRKAIAQFRRQQNWGRGKTLAKILAKIM